MEVQTEEKRNVISNRQEKRKAQKSKKQSEQIKVPKARSQKKKFKKLVEFSTKGLTPPPTPVSGKINK